MKTFVGSFLSRKIFLFPFVILAFLCVSCLPSGVYMKMGPPPDVDKAFIANPALPSDNTCYLATASNMLAGAGYGSGDTVQDRADEIYGEMVAAFGTADGGWTDTALDWWITSDNNVWPNNPYTDVTVDGNKNPKYPWAEPDGARDIGNYLRDCDFVGLSFSWPTDDVGVIGVGGHAITCWGDDGGDATLTVNPAKVRVVDSDRDTGGNVQSYTYDAYTNPNPGGANEGNGWYFNYTADHPYIKHIIVLSPTESPSGGKMTQEVVGSYKIHQSQKIEATDLHYEVGADADILSYKTTIDWPTENLPSITESEPQRRLLTVDWDLSDKPVPYCTWVTITTEFMLPRRNAVVYDDVHFTYPKIVEIVEVPAVPSLSWEMETPMIENPTSIPNVTGGYVVGSFDIVNPDLPPAQGVVGQYRFVHEYSFDQSPEYHLFKLTGEMGYYATDFRFGHSYGLLDTESLWEFKNWMTEIPERPYPLEDKPIELRINWEGRLPYPEGEIIPTPTPTPKPPFNWGFLVGILAGVVAIGLVAYYVVRKRLKAKGSG